MTIHIPDKILLSLDNPKVINLSVTLMKTCTPNGLWNMNIAIWITSEVMKTNQFNLSKQSKWLNSELNFTNAKTFLSKQIGHFTQMVSDNVDEVGCCVSMYEKRGDKPKDPLMKYVYIVCNYSYISISNRAIYVEGKPKCKKFSKKYKSLCCK